MDQCLRCRKTCEQGLFCDNCQSALLRRSLQEQETHEWFAQVSLARYGSLAELNASKSSEQDSVIQTSLCIATQGVMSGGEDDECDNTPPNKVPWYAKQSATLAILQALSPQRIRLSRLKYMFFVMLIISVIALIVDSVLVSLIIYRHHVHVHVNNNRNVPLMTFMPGMVYPGQITRLHLSHFSAGARILLRRDIENQLHPDTGSPLIQLGSAGEADVHILVEDNWGTGRHFIEAEDINMHYIASTVIQVMGSGLEQVPHLQVSQSEPALGISPTSMTFRVTQGEDNPPDQAVTVVNTGGNLLYWQAHTDTTVSPWLQISPATGSLVGGRNGHIFLGVNTASLSAGTYRSNVVVSATDSSGAQVSGSPQEVAVVLDVVQPCVLQVTPTSLSFSASLLAPEPAKEDITLRTVGSCAYPVTWTATVDANSRSWLILSAISGQDSGDGSMITVGVNTSGMLLGFYQGQISVSAVDGNGTSVGSTTPTVGVALTVIG